MRPAARLAVVAALAAATAAPADPPPRPREGTLKVGDPAPAVTLTDLRTDKPVRLTDLRGKPVVLIFGSCT
jgi:cytochrome oxidase Cu insertion factor (SCO1/SenC/PrrC family)